MIKRSTHMRLIMEGSLSDKDSIGLRDAQTNEPIARRVSEALIQSLMSETASQVDSIGQGDCVLVGCDVVRDSIAGFGGESKTSDELDDIRSAMLLASWSQSGWEAFDEQFAMLDEKIQSRGARLMIEPSIDGMLSDAISTCAWARRHGGANPGSHGWSMLIDPVGWLVDSMMRDADDHLRRFSELCIDCPSVELVRVRSVKRAEDGSLVACSLRDGDLDSAMILDRLGGMIEKASGVVVLDEADGELISGR